MKIPEKLLLESPDQRAVLSSGVDETVSVLTERLAGARTAVLFTGRRSAERCGALAAVEAAAKLAGCRLERFCDIEPEPCISTVEKMRAFLAAHQAEAVVGFLNAVLPPAAAVCSTRRRRHICRIRPKRRCRSTSAWTNIRRVIPKPS